MEFDLVTLIKDLGFPGAVVVYFMWYNYNVTKPWTEVMVGVRDLLKDIKEGQR